MLRLVHSLVFAGLTLGASHLSVGQGAGASWPPPAELHALLQATVPSLPLPAPPGDMTNSMAYLRTLAPEILLDAPAAGQPAVESSLGRTAVYEAGMGYLRVDAVDATLPGALERSLSGLLSTNPLHGLILDLRFAGGADFASSAEAAGMMARRRNDGFRLGNDPWVIEPRGALPEVPVMILVNGQTREAAEALAAAVRATVTPSLVIGTNTAGWGRVYQTVQVAPELRVRVAQAALVLPDGKTLSAQGLVPDVEVALSADDELSYRTNEFRRAIQGMPVETNGSFRVNEAELIRRQLRQRVGHPTVAPAATPPAVQDPVLGTALDLLNGWVGRDSTPSAGRFPLTPCDTANNVRARLME